MFGEEAVRTARIRKLGSDGEPWDLTGVATRAQEGPGVDGHGS